MKRKVAISTKKSKRGGVTPSAAERRQMETELRQAEERIALSALDALSTQIAILDSQGTILASNKAWREFARDDSGKIDRGPVGADYFALNPNSGNSEVFAQFADGVKAVLDGSRPEFSMEYSCQIRGEERWFNGRAARFGNKGAPWVLIAHDDISKRVQLEREIVDVSAREQQRFGQELHDGLSQRLTGLKFKASLLEYQLQSRNLPEANDAKAISKLLNEATDEASGLARSVRPVETEARGLMMALGELATRASNTHRIKCVCLFRRPVFLHDNNVATHVYRIAEEAVANALQHGDATDIRLTLAETKDCVTLTVRDNGRGLPKNFLEDGGLGLHMMRYRARMIGGSVELRRDTPRGTVLSCSFQKRAVPSQREKTAEH